MISMKNAIAILKKLHAPAKKCGAFYFYIISRPNFGLGSYGNFGIIMVK